MKSEEYENWFVDGERPMTAPEPTAQLDLRRAERAGHKTMLKLEAGLKYQGLSLAGAKVVPGGLEEDDPVVASPRRRSGRPAPPPVPADVARDTVRHDIQGLVPTANLRDRVAIVDDEPESQIGDDEETRIGSRSTDLPASGGDASLLETDWLIEPAGISDPPLERLLRPVARGLRRVAARPELAGLLARVHRVVQRAPVPVLAGVAAVLLVGMTAAAMAGPEHGASTAPVERTIPAPIVPLVPASSAPAEVPPAPAPLPEPALPAADGPADFDFTGESPAGQEGGEQAQDEPTASRSTVRSSRAARVRRARAARARRARVARARALRARRARR